MSDDKVKPSDRAGQGDTDEKPMEKPKVKVRVRPVKHKARGRMSRADKEKVQRQNEENQGLAEKVEKNLEGEIKKKVEDAGSRPDATRQDQYDAADDAAEEAANQTSRRKINKIEYSVGDDDGRHEGELEPSEGTPPEDEDE